VLSDEVAGNISVVP